MRVFSTRNGNTPVSNKNVVLFGIECGDPHPVHLEYLSENGFRVHSNTAVRTAPIE